MSTHPKSPSVSASPSASSSARYAASTSTATSAALRLPNQPAMAPHTAADAPSATTALPSAAPALPVKVTLFCVLVGTKGSAFPVDIDLGESLGHLKKAIKAEKPSKITCDAKELDLYLAKKGDAWLPSNDPAALELGRGRIHQDIQAMIDGKEMDATSSIQECLEDKNMSVPSTKQIHVLVVVPALMLSQLSLSWKKPKSLVATAGAEWDFQNSLNLDKLASAIGDHYQAWKARKKDKRSHPIFVCLDGPGTGKSRLLDEFPNVLQQLGCDEAQGDPAMNLLLQKAYTFKVTFGNGRAYNNGFAHVPQMIGTRMLHQLQDAHPWMTLAGDPTFHRNPEQVLSELSAITGTAASEMCVILCVDSLQMLQHTPGTRDSAFCSAFATLCDLVNDSKYWVIVICAATVGEVLVTSSQWTVMLQTTPLKRPEINGRDVLMDWTVTMEI